MEEGEKPGRSLGKFEGDRVGERRVVPDKTIQGVNDNP